MRAQFESLLAHVLTACLEYYGQRLVSLAVFGSVGRGTPRPDSDIDLLIVAEALPNGRLKRVDEFCVVEAKLAPRLAEARIVGLAAELSPIFKTPAEVQQGSLLFLDMTEDARILHDRDNFLRKALTRFKEQLNRLGARRVWRGNAWFWDLKPDYKPGEVFEIYGDIDFTPTEEYDRAGALRAIADAKFVVSVAESVIGPANAADEAPESA